MSSFEDPSESVDPNDRLNRLVDNLFDPSNISELELISIAHKYRCETYSLEQCHPPTTDSEFDRVDFFKGAVFKLAELVTAGERTHEEITPPFTYEVDPSSLHVWNNSKGEMCVAGVVCLRDLTEKPLGAFKEKVYFLPDVDTRIQFISNAKPRPMAVRIPRALPL